MSGASEIEIAAAVVHWLEETGWDVYQEVVVGGPRADIIGLQGPLVRVVEVKTSFTAAVVEQAYHWLGWAHFVHIAVPAGKRSAHRHTGRWVLERFCRDHGIGIIKVRDSSWSKKREFNVEEDVRAQLHRKALADRVRKAVQPEHKRWGKAGNADHAYWTPWRGTCEAWRRYVEKHPGCGLKELIEEAGHHYHCDSTARSCMARYLRSGVVPGISVRQGRGNRLLLYPKGQGPKTTGRGRRPVERQP